MSQLVTVTLTCDICGRSGDSVDESANEARRSLRGDGWHIYADADICDDCHDLWHRA